MTDPDDQRLLAEFAHEDSEASFAALVQRHVNLVYSVALRSVGNVHAAEEITQAVFIILARKAKNISRKVILSGWLYQTTRLTAANFLRGEIRRQQREQEAYMQSTLNEPDLSRQGEPAADANLWPQIAPLLDDALDKLGERDRHAIVLRFFENKNLDQVGVAQGASGDAAKMRVNRALEKLRKFFSKRGVNSTTAIIAGVLSAHSVQAAPATLAKSAAAVAISKGTAAGGSAMTLVKGVLHIMAWQKLKLATAIGAVVILAAGTTTLIAQHQPQTNAVISYKMLEDACQFTDGFDQNKLVVRMVVASSKAVRPADIHLTIQSTAKGPIAVQLGPKGQILNFPHDEVLHRENPSVIANQPKGTLRLGLWFYVPLPPELTFSYSRLGDAVAEANNGVARANKSDFAKAMLSFGDKLKVQSVIFVFPKSSAKKATIVIEAAAGRKKLTADADGTIQIKMDKSLLTENPQVTMSEKPQYAVPAPD